MHTTTAEYQDQKRLDSVAQARNCEDFYRELLDLDTNDLALESNVDACAFYEDVVTLFKQHHGDVAEFGYHVHTLIKQQAQRIAACRFKQNIYEE